VAVEQVLRRRCLGVRRPGRYDGGGEQADQREAGRDEHGHYGPVRDAAVDGHQGRGRDRHAERRTALPGGGGVPLAGLVGRAALLSEALGFGLQRFVPDIGAGFFITAER
jgi:hypothetical protein